MLGGPGDGPAGPLRHCRRCCRIRERRQRRGRARLGGPDRAPVDREHSLDGPDAGLDERGNLSLPDPSFSPYRQRARDMPITMVALRTLGAMDGRSALRGDVRTVLTVAYAATRPVVWSDDEGARLLARTGTGGYRRPEASDARGPATCCEAKDDRRQADERVRRAGASSR